MASASIHLHEGDLWVVTARVIVSPEHGPWISLDFGGVSVYLPGFGAPNVAKAREIAAALTTAADEMDALLAKQEVPTEADAERQEVR